MHFQAPRDHFTLDTAAAASVLDAWENAQRHALHHPPMHRSHMLYNNYGFPISPVSPSSSHQSSSANAMLTLPGNAWATPSSMSSSELEMLHLHGGREMITASSAAPASLADRQPGLAGANQPNAAALFDFDFTFAQNNIPQLSLPLQHHEQEQYYLHRQQSQACLTPPPPSLLTPLTPDSSSSTLIASPPATPPNKAAFRRESESPSSSIGTKRSSEERDSSTTGNAKRPRQCMSVKDFVPPDVTGLSKREARLVKNRAAAFLSRQRKREEFELMEIRVAELERENVRLREVAEGVSSSSPAPSPDSSELDLLRMQLAASRQREADLVHKLEVLKHETHKIKAEASEPSLSDGTSSNSPTIPKTGASFGLMALLCALPSLLSQSHSSSAPSTACQYFPDANQWDMPPSTSAMNDRASCAEERWEKLELDAESKLAGTVLGSLDVSFSTSQTKEGKIRVLIRSSPSPSPSPSRSTSEHVHMSKPVSASSTPDDVINPTTHLAALSLPSPSRSHTAPSPESGDENGNNNPPSFLFADSDVLGPFLGAAPSHSAATFDLGPAAPFDFSTINPACIVSGLPGVQSTLAISRPGEKQQLQHLHLQHSARVRISLCSLPHPGGEGGEWEIEVR